MLNMPSYDLAALLDNLCKQHELTLTYAAYMMSLSPTKADITYYGEIILASFRLVAIENQKNPAVCRQLAFRRVFDILTSKYELAVRLAANVKRNPNLRLDNSDRNVNVDADFECELYRLDWDESLASASASSINTTGSAKDSASSLSSSATFGNNNTTMSKENIVDLNALLKSMILPKEAQQQFQQQSNGESLMNSLLVNEDSKDSQADFEDCDDDEDEATNKTQNVDKKARQVFEPV